MSNAHISSKKGLVAIREIKGFPLLNDYTSSPILCQGFMTSLLNQWCSQVVSIIEKNGCHVPDSSVEAMRLYLERSKTQVDQTTICYRIIYECKEAVSFLEKSKKTLETAYGLEDQTILQIKRSGLFDYDDSAIAYQASYHVFQAQHHLHIAEVLGSEDIIFHGQKSIKRLKIARQASAQQRKRDADYLRWQNWANEIWEKNPSHSITRVAEFIKTKHNVSQSARTIRKKIQKVGHV